MREGSGPEGGSLRELVGDYAYEKAYGAMTDAEGAAYMDAEFVSRAKADAEVHARIPDESGVEAMNELADRFRRMGRAETISAEDWEAIRPWVETKLARAEEEIARTRTAKSRRPFQEASVRHAKIVSFRDWLRGKVRDGKQEAA